MVTEEQYLEAKSIIEQWIEQQNISIIKISKEIKENQQLLKIANGSFRNLHLSDLDLNSRVYNILKTEDIRTLGEIYDIYITDKFQLLKLRGFGKDCMAEIEASLRRNLLIE